MDLKRRGELKPVPKYEPSTDHLVIAVLKPALKVAGTKVVGTELVPRYRLLITVSINNSRVGFRWEMFYLTTHSTDFIYGGCLSGLTYMGNMSACMSHELKLAGNGFAPH